MKKSVNVLGVLLFCLAGLLFVSCEAVFTYSPLSEITWLKRDVSKLSAGQQQAYARSLLESGADPEALMEAYLLIAAQAGRDPELNLLAADLALGASGINTILTTVITQAASGEDMDFEELLADLNIDVILQASEHILIALEEDPDAPVSNTQYIVAATALIFAALQEEEDPDDLSDNPNYQQAEEYLAAAGIDIESFGGLFL